MSTERYEPPEDPFGAVRSTMAAWKRERLRRWFLRWGLGLPLAYLVGIVLTDWTFLFWIAVVVAGISLAFTLAVGRFVSRRMPGPEAPLDVGATVDEEEEARRVGEIEILPPPRRDD